MTGFLISLGMTSYTLSILFFALKPIVNKLLSIKTVICYICTLGSIIRTSMVTKVTMPTQPLPSRPHPPLPTQPPMLSANRVILC
jgi:hypothetical protein